jgi:shikimate dehydrogenase
VLIAMGEHGIATRILAAHFRAAWTYAGAVPDVGQLAPDALVNEFRFREIGSRSSVYGVLGLPVTHSVSPAMHNAGFRAKSIDAVYVPLAAIDADDAMSFADAIGLAGASVTIPHKVTLARRMDAIDETSRRIGAINTIQRNDGRWIGANTDAEGFLRPLDARRVALSGRRVAILGSGGSARAVAVALTSRGAHVAIHGRNQAAAAEVAALAGGTVGSVTPDNGSWEILVNCTPVGMHPQVDATPIASRALTGQLVYDLVYNPPGTRLLRDGEAAGCQTIGGIEMLVAQAEAQFERWTGACAPAGLMREAADRRLREFVTHADHLV